jgi:hypothetical protein
MILLFHRIAFPAVGLLIIFCCWHIVIVVLSITSIDVCVCFNILFISVIELGGDRNAFRESSDAAYNVKYIRVSFYNGVTFVNIWL